MRDAAIFGVFVLFAAVVSITLLGPYWFLLVLGLALVAWVIIGVCMSSGRASEWERERWRRNRGD